MDKITIFLGDDHSIVRDGLKLILESEPGFSVIGESGDGKECIDLIEKLKPHIAVIDISMPTISGIDVARHVKKYAPETKVLILSRHDKEEYVEKLLSYGINGYVLKDDAGEDIIRAIEEIFKGNIYLSPKLANAIYNSFMKSKKSLAENEQTSFQQLTTREREVLKLIAEGYSGKEISEILRIAAKTVKTHRANIMRKLDIHKTADLVAYAIKNGLIEV